MRRDRTRWLHLLLVGAGAIGVGTSLLLLYEYLAVTPRFCDPGGGCELVRHSAYSSVAGIPLPVFGLVFFAGALGSGFLAARLARKFFGVIGVIGVLSGAALLAIQAFAIGAWCPFCVAVDLSAIAAGIAGLGLAAGPPREREPLGNVAALVVSLGIVAPMLVGTALAPPVATGVERVVDRLPAPVAAEQRPGVATIVEYLDFECPFCREQYRVLAPLVEDYGDRVRVVYKMVPMPMHINARPAAKLYMCAEEQGKGHAVADALFSHDELSDEAIDSAASSVGLEPEALAACLASERPDARIEADLDEARLVGVYGLPTLYIGTTRIEGKQDRRVVQDVIETALD